MWLWARGLREMSLALEQPLRYPDLTSQPLMSKRAVWLVVVGFLLPGAAQVLAGNRRLGRVGLSATLLLLLGLVVAAVTFFTARSVLFELFTKQWVLLLTQVLLVVYAVLWLVLGFDTLRLAKLVRVRANRRLPVALLSIILTVAPAVGAAWGASTLNAGRELLHSVFQGAPAVAPVDGRYNILLLGADAGADREGLRPDSISLVSVDAETGQSVIIGLPRELKDMPFPESSPMHAVFPEGFCDEQNNYVPSGDGLYCFTTGNLNALITEVEDSGSESYAGIYPHAKERGSSPGIEATKDAVEGATGLKVQFYVLINMDGFSNVIDALGGIDINVQERLPIGGHIDEVTGELVGVDGWIEPGKQHLNGYQAQWYARSRYGSANGDYDRMARQRELQAAILQQMNPSNVLLRFQEVAKAGQQLLETDIPDSMLGRFVDLATKARAHTPVNVELVPPAVDPDDPDYAAIHEMVAQGVQQASPPKEEKDKQ